ncbi:Cytosolic Fe-S cluster assembly factor NBP35 [Hibiscus syriacus]|uniref:Cytosolic Fe-S cluster assembly factor NBP35 n=1 Tax=Hibiscus syriacus TaxID=106335 RepID=A0A6A3CR52_HIBSY|nr:Cytosolic Fe-S cluster assembly factor NBP35 [Hibiscus syriacus]
MTTVKHKILILSGKGGGCKSTFSAQLSFALAAKDFQVGLLDIDICGPRQQDAWVMSIGFLLPDSDETVIWRGPRKNRLIKQFLKDVYWGELDFLTGEHTDVTEKVIEYTREKAPELLDLIAASEVFDSSSGGAAKMCSEMGVPFLGKVPLDPQLCRAAEEGKSCFADPKCGVSTPALKIIIEKLVTNYWPNEMSVE